MSLIESLASSLESMGFVELAVAFAALIGYSLAINRSLPRWARWQATLATFAAAAAFSTLAPSSASGVVLLLIGVLGLGAFAACAWLASALFGLTGAPGPVVAQGGGVEAGDVRTWPRVASGSPVVHPS